MDIVLQWSIEGHVWKDVGYLTGERATPEGRRRELERVREDPDLLWRIVGRIDEVLND